MRFGRGRATGTVMMDYQLVRDAAAWLFLPTVENGRPRGGRVQFPIKF